MYCGSCMRDNTLAAALIEQGHECLLIPTYTPIRTDEPDVSLNEVFFGGITVYLEQQSSLFRHVPDFIDRWLSRPWLLNWVTRKYGMKTRPEDLGALTISMLQGNHGHQRRDVLRMARWLAADIRPEIICLSNALISGIIPELKGRLGAPIVCTLQGDDIYLDWLPEPYRSHAIALVRENCRQVDRFLTTSAYYADFMADYLALPRDRIAVVHPGINLRGYPREKPSRNGLTRELALGYLARICPEKGLHVLIDAFHRLRRMPDVPACRLLVAGYLGDRDRPYLADLVKQVETNGWKAHFDHVGELTHADKIKFLSDLDLFSVPTTYREPKGLYLLEAWACGVPAVQPSHGSFPELIQASGGGVLFQPGDAAGLADQLRFMLKDDARRRSLAEAGHRKAHEWFHAGRMAAETQQVFAGILADRA